MTQLAKDVPLIVMAAAGMEMVGLRMPKVVRLAAVPRRSFRPVIDLYSWDRTQDFIFSF